MCIGPRDVRGSRRSYLTTRALVSVGRQQRSVSHSREDGDDGDVSRVDTKDEDYSDHVPNHTIDLVSFGLAHQEAQISFPYFFERVKVKSQEVDAVHQTQECRKCHEERLQRRRVEVIQD